MQWLSANTKIYLCTDDMYPKMVRFTSRRSTIGIDGKRLVTIAFPRSEWIQFHSRVLHDTASHRGIETFSIYIMRLDHRERMPSVGSYSFHRDEVAVKFYIISISNFDKQKILCYKCNPHTIQISMVSCQKGPTRHAYAWQIGPFWQDTLDM